jgi:hypothetical protein
VQPDTVMREHILELLAGGHAHMPFEEAIADFPMAHINTVFPNGTYTPWHLLEHLRISQWDILDFIRNPNYQEMEWPKDYWPPQDQQATPEDWERTVQSFQADMRQLQEMVKDPATDLYAKIPHGTGQTIFREMLLVADHNAYHIGEFAIMRQVMGTWGQGHQ